MNRNFITEIAGTQQNKHGNPVCGDCFVSRKVKEESRYVAVLSDGLGSGIKANVLATLTASMALNFTIRKAPLMQTARSIMDTLPVDSVRAISYSTFSIIDVDCDGETRIVEYGNPLCIIVRDGELMELEREKILVEGQPQPRVVYSSSFIARKEDRVIMVSDGVTQSGIGNASLPFGWGKQNLQEYILQHCEQHPQISAADLSRHIVNKAVGNDIYKPQDDVSCSTIYFREPRQTLVCTGPPFEMDKDKYLADTVVNFSGRKIVCGGTTAQILSRELDREIEVGLLPDKSGLPPESVMEGIDLITEGILTIGQVAEMFEHMQGIEVNAEGPAGDIARILLESDVINFVVGTRVNNAHQDPSLPEELEIRRNVVKRIVRLLEEKFLKEVTLKFI